MKQIIATATIGCELNAKGTTIDPETLSLAIKGLRDNLTRQFGGCTAVEGAGSFEMGDGRIDAEACVQVSSVMEDVDYNRDHFVNACKLTRDSLGAETVLVTFTPTEYQFI